MNEIHINQLGYRSYDPKKAVIPCLTAAELSGGNKTGFQIVRFSDKAVVYKGMAGEPVFDSASAETVRIADFSDFKEAGEYFLYEGERRSYPFVIKDNPYRSLRTALLEMFNYQKCGVDLECGLWSHPACHAVSATIYGTGEKKDVTGGWHDAGDYGRYIVPAAKAVADLLLAHEFSSSPEPHLKSLEWSGEVSLLNERLLETVWFEIEWMLKMQDEKTGGVYHKVSCERFDALDEMPHDERGELILSPISATATADFAASMALASRFYPEHKDKLLNAAKHAWNWCAANPDVPGFVNPAGISTGGYGDSNDRDERFWAACELFTATGDEKYHDYIKAGEFISEDYRNDKYFGERKNIFFPFGLGWGNVETYGHIAYLQNASGMTDNSIKQRIKNNILRSCDDIMELCKKSPYGISLGEVFRWGSNMTVANNAMMLILGSRFAANGAGYTEAALEHFHYLLGKNPLSQSYVTGFGANPSKNPHHRPSVAKGSAVPGMVVGGPCMGAARDEALNTHCAEAPPAKRYIDHRNSYVSNEITIYWNSPVYFVMAALGL